jgi:hypothetical protein
MAKRMAFEFQIKQRLGAPAKLPKDFYQAPTLINVAAEGDSGLYAHVEIKQASRESFHRVMVSCPRCHAEMSMGRLNQHFNTKRCPDMTI